jgi:Leucine-rich repeat (LRR) protein
MARIPRLMSLNNKLNKITDEITNMKESLKRLDVIKKELEDQIKQAELVELDNLISNRGLTFEEVKELLKK